MSSTTRLPVSEGRLWAGMLVAPTSWALAELIGYPIVARSCEAGMNGYGVRGLTAPLAVAVAIDVLFAVIAAFAVFTARGNKRVLAAHRTPNDSGARAESGAVSPGAIGDDPDYSRAKFMAGGGVIVSAVFLAGIVFFAAAPFFLDVCKQTR